MSERTKELERLVNVARSELRQAERLANEYAHGLHLSRVILKQREEALALARKNEAEEEAARG